MVGATCVVTGGSGAIGRLLCRQLAEGGTRVVNLDVKAPSGSLEGVEDVRVDL